MSSIREAVTAEDRRRVLAVAHAANASSAPPAYYEALRLRLPRRHAGTWWLLEDGGAAACSLMCYPLAFSTGGGIVPGYGIGAVATRPEARGRGFATALCAHAIASAESQGRAAGLLFSAIAPAFYERLAFRATPAWNPACARPADLAASGPQAGLVPVDPRRDVPCWLDAYAKAHGGLHLPRDEAGWHDALLRNPDDVFLALGEPARGYVRLYVAEPPELHVAELMVPPAERAAVLRAVAALAVAMGRERVEGWFDPVPELAPHFEDEGRATTQPMVRGVEDLETARFWSSDHF